MSEGNEASGNDAGEREDHHSHCQFLQEESGENLPAQNHLQTLLYQQQGAQPQTDSQPNTGHSSFAGSGSSASQSTGVFHFIHLPPPGPVLPRDDYISLHPPNNSAHFENYTQMRQGHDDGLAHVDLEASLNGSYDSGPSSLSRGEEISLRDANPNGHLDGELSHNSETAASFHEQTLGSSSRESDERWPPLCPEQTLRKTLACSGEEGTFGEEESSAHLETSDSGPIGNASSSENGNVTTHLHTSDEAPIANITPSDTGTYLKTIDGEPTANNRSSVIETVDTHLQTSDWEPNVNSTSTGTEDICTIPQTSNGGPIVNTISSFTDLQTSDQGPNSNTTSTYMQTTYSCPIANSMPSVSENFDTYVQPSNEDLFTNIISPGSEAVCTGQHMLDSSHDQETGPTVTSGYATGLTKEGSQQGHVERSVVVGQQTIRKSDQEKTPNQQSSLYHEDPAGGDQPKGCHLHQDQLLDQSLSQQPVRELVGYLSRQMEEETRGESSDSC